MPSPQLHDLSTLTPEQRREVRDLHAAATAADAVAPLSEQGLLALTDGDGRVRHLLRYAAGRLAGHAQVGWPEGGEPEGGGPASAELVVDPVDRRHGIGTELWQAVAAQAPDVRIWAHGDLPAARRLAASAGLTVVRELHKMARPLSPADTDPARTALPPGLRARAFEVGRDEQAWLQTNAAAFASHPEQGALRLADLRERMDQAWFDPAGFIVVEPTDAPGTIAAFHWTKVDPEQRSSTDPASTAGEVYVVGVAPAYQGRGLGRPVTALGLAHLARLGLPEVVLYVDGDNEAAIHTYTALGFRSIMVDVMYSRTVHRPLSG